MEEQIKSNVQQESQTSSSFCLCSSPPLPRTKSQWQGIPHTRRTSSGERNGLTCVVLVAVKGTRCEPSLFVRPCAETSRWHTETSCWDQRLGLEKQVGSEPAPRSLWLGVPPSPHPLRASVCAALFVLHSVSLLLVVWSNPASHH